MKMYPSEPDEEILDDEKEEEVRPSSSGMLIFIAAFAVSLVLFAIIGVVWWITSGNTAPAPTDDPAITTPTTQPTVQPNLSENRFSVAVYITDNQGNLQTVSLVMVHPDQETTPISVVGLPAEFSLSDTSQTDTLQNSYRLPYIDVAQDALCAYFEKDIRYYVVLTYNQIEEQLTDLGGNLLYTVKKPIDITAKDKSYSVKLSAGETSLTTKQVTNLFRFDDWQGGRIERAQMHADLIAAYLNQFLSSSRDLQNDYQVLRRNAADMNLSDQDFKSIQPTLRDLSNKGLDALCTRLNTTGSFFGSGNTLRFVASQDMRKTIKNSLPDLS